MNFPRESGKILIAGHSHIFCLGAEQGWDGPLAKAYHESNELVSFLQEKWTGNRSKEYWSFLGCESECRNIVILYNGNQHFGTFLMSGFLNYDIWDPKVPMSDSVINSVILERSRVQEFVKESYTELRSILKTLSQKNVFIAMTPPPQQDFSAYIDRVRNAKFFINAAKREGLNPELVKFASPSFLLKLWNLMRDELIKIADEYGVGFIDIPENVKTDFGFLDSKYSCDLTHANTEYGELFLNYILERVCDYGKSL